jgi:hypothetical protein
MKSVAMVHRLPALDGRLAEAADDVRRLETLGSRM